MQVLIKTEIVIKERYMQPEKIINVGNADLIIEQALTPSKLAMIKWESIFDFYAEEPISITLQIKEDGKKMTFEKIIRIREWGEKECFSWSVYSQNREKINDIVLRKVVWDKQKDKNTMIACNEKYEEILNWWPSISVTNIYIPDAEVYNIRELIENMDTIMQKSIIFKKKKTSITERINVEYLRLYDWGQLHFTWESDKHIKGLSKNIRKLCKEFEKLLVIPLKEVASMSLNYSIPIDLYKKVYILGEYN